jgi:hypothetical protein
MSGEPEAVLRIEHPEIYAKRLIRNPIKART